MRRSIPARAGEPGIRSRCRWICRVYPRACGGTVLTLNVVDPPTGLSPRVRGNRYGWHTRTIKHGSIPARAGEPTQARYKSIVE